MTTLLKLYEAQDLKELGNLLRLRRKEMGVTQEQAAALCNVSPRFIGEVERGKATAEIGKVLQLIRGYGLRITICDRKLGET